MKIRALVLLPLLVACDPSALSDVGGAQDASAVATSAPRASTPSPKASATTDQASRFSSLLAGRSLEKLLHDAAVPDVQALQQGPDREAMASAANADARCVTTHSQCNYVGALAFKEWQTATTQAAGSVTTQLQQEATAQSEGDAPFIAYIGLQVQAEAATVSVAPPVN